MANRWTINSWNQPSCVCENGLEFDGFKTETAQMSTPPTGAVHANAEQPDALVKEAGVHTM